ncbi:MAG: type II secretion system protein [Patescibacteria group bacterium]|jgi:type II secretory pathway pseudopilin PulG
MNKNLKAFTLIEILLAVAALVILVSIVILAINPGKQLADTRNSQRWVDVNTILNGVYQYSIDNEGDLPSTLDGTAKNICQAGVAVGAGCAISLDFLIPTYLVSIPSDPKFSTTDGTGYTISTSTSANRIQVSAPSAEEGKTIEVIR